ncbi:MAG: SigF/SigG family RNA polymerase sporulation sigma factor [Lachnospiraceae bacterium]|nr:SigF/SigG family RNA polymerase sporulation sigma factor [Lachnospiraceae bacterium]
MEEVAVLIARSQGGDKEARERLIEKNLGLVHHIVKRFLGRGYDSEDLFQIGSIGLMKAIDKFDLSFDVKFSTYAVPMISGEIKRFLRDDGMVKVSRSLKENGWKVNQASERIFHTKGREATLEEIAEATGLSREDIILAMEANVEVESIYKSVYQSDGNEVYIVDRLPEKRDENEKLLNHMLLEQLLNELGEDESRLIRLRYFQDKTQVEVAKRMGISQVQVSRLEKKILIRMRERIG